MYSSLTPLCITNEIVQPCTTTPVNAPMAIRSGGRHTTGSSAGILRKAEQKAIGRHPILVRHSLNLRVIRAFSASLLSLSSCFIMADETFRAGVSPEVEPRRSSATAVTPAGDCIVNIGEPYSRSQSRANTLVNTSDEKGARKHSLRLG